MYIYIWEFVVGECCRYDSIYDFGRFSLVVMWELGGRK